MLKLHAFFLSGTYQFVAIECLSEKKKSQRKNIDIELNLFTERTVSTSCFKKAKFILLIVYLGLNFKIWSCNANELESQEQIIFREDYFFQSL